MTVSIYEMSNGYSVQVLNVPQVVSLDDLYNAVLSALSGAVVRYQNIWQAIAWSDTAKVELWKTGTADILVGDEWVRIDKRSQLAAVIREALA